MFNLDQAIAGWRRQMATAGITSTQVLDELESHLRDDVAAQLDAGKNAREAFDSAAGRIGDPMRLRKEFGKSAPKAMQRRMVQGLFFASAFVVLLINIWILRQFDLSFFERFAGLAIAALTAAHVAAVPFLRRSFSRAAFGRFTVALKIATILLSLAIIVMFLDAERFIHIEIGIVTNMVVWSLCVAVVLSPFAALFGSDELHGGPDGSGGSPSFIFPGIRPAPSAGGWSRQIPLPPSDSFAPIAHQCMQVAREEATRLGHDYIGTEHLLLGVLAQTTGALTSILRSNNLDGGSVRMEIERLVCAQPVHSSPALPLTPRACKALQLAGAEAKTFRNRLINPEHLLLGLLIEGRGVAAQALKNLGVRIDRIRAEVSRVPAQT